MNAQKIIEELETIQTQIEVPTKTLDNLTEELKNNFFKTAPNRFADDGDFCETPMGAELSKIKDTIANLKASIDSAINQALHE